MMEETKRCPYCGEEILATAKKCKHCGEWLDKTAAPKKTWIYVCLAGVLVALGVTLLFLFRKPSVQTDGPQTAAAEFDFAGEAIAGYEEDDRETIYEYIYSGRLFSEAESHGIVLHYTEFPVDDDGDGWFDVSGGYNYPEWQKNGEFSFDGRTSGERLLLFTENSELFDLMSYDRGFVLKGEWYKYKSNDDRDHDRGSWTKHLRVELHVAKQ